MTQLNKEQLDALENLRAFFNSDLTFFYLLGDAGTGKSFTISQALNDGHFLPSEAIALAPSHKAKKVLSNFFKNSGFPIECKTIHSALGMVLKEDDDRGRTALEKNSKNDGVLDQKNLIIIDEISMLDQKIIDELLYQINSSYHRKKVILLGDIKQLPPIGLTTFPAMELAGQVNHMRSDLVTVMRYENENLKNFIEEAKKVINYNLEQLKNNGFLVEFQPYRFIPKDDPDFLIMDYQTAMEKFIELRRRKKDVVALAFKNATLEKIASEFREGLYSDILQFLPNKTLPDYLEGEVYTCNQPLGQITSYNPLQVSNKTIFTNGDQLQLLKFEESQIKELDVNFQDYKVFNSFILTVKNQDSITGEISVIKNGKEYQKFVDSFKRAATKAKKTGGDHKKFYRRFFYLLKLHSDIRVKEVLSIHKSQGSSYDHVFLFDDITAGKDKRKEAQDNFVFMQSRLWYVGASRAKKQLIIVKV